MRKTIKDKNLFKFAALIIMSFFIISSFPFSAGAAAGDIEVNIGDSYGNMEGVTTIPVNISNVSSNGISSFDFSLEFPSSLHVLDVRAGDVISNSGDFLYSIKGNKINILFSDSKGGENPIKTDGILFYLDVKLESSFTGAVIKPYFNSKINFYDNNLNALKATVNKGTVTFVKDLKVVSSDKIWKVSFNQEINEENIKGNYIEVKDSKGEKINCTYRLAEGGMALEILPPKDGYEKFKGYSLKVKKGLLSKRGKGIKRDYDIKFYINK